MKRYIISFLVAIAVWIVLVAVASILMAISVFDAEFQPVNTWPVWIAAIVAIFIFWLLSKNISLSLVILTILVILSWPLVKGAFGL